MEKGYIYPLPDLFHVHLDGKAADGAAASENGAGLHLPGVDEMAGTAKREIGGPRAEVMRY